MNTETIVYCVVALVLGMLLANMLKSVCGCKNLVEGQSGRGHRTTCHHSHSECDWTRWQECSGSGPILIYSDECYDKCPGPRPQCPSTPTPSSTHTIPLGSGPIH